MPHPLFGLIDCNNFFVSCERIFRPDLEGRPVVVLSSNDGCVIARSNEAKALGLPMGAPVFKYRALLTQHRVVQFSANFELYADISRRISRLLSRLTPQIEVYSIDESFLDLSQLPIPDHAEWGRALRQRIWRETGVPVSVGIAPTKTLAKLASEQAKRDASWQGSCSWPQLSAAERAALLEQTPVGELWGVGWRLRPQLQAAGIHTGLDLARTAPPIARQLVGSKHGAQLVAELNGCCCQPLETGHKTQQSIMRGRTFGEDTDQLSVIRAAIASLSARAAFQLRREKRLARTAGIDLNTSRYKPGYRRWWLPVTFDTPTNDSGLIASRLIAALNQAFIPGQAYHRATVFLLDFVPADRLQTDLLGLVDLTAADRSQRRMLAIDRLNSRYGKASLHYAAEDVSRRWQPKQRLGSPHYTTNWNDLPEVHL